MANSMKSIDVIQEPQVLVHPGISGSPKGTNPRAQGASPGKGATQTAPQGPTGCHSQSRPVGPLTSVYWNDTAPRATTLGFRITAFQACGTYIPEIPG